MFINIKNLLDSLIKSKSSSNDGKSSKLALTDDCNNNFKLTKKCTFERNIDEINFVKEFFNAIKCGSPEDTEFIKQCLLEDPNKTRRGPKDDALRSNMNNFNSEFPLYLASKYNNLNVIRILFDGK